MDVLRKFIEIHSKILKFSRKILILFNSAADPDKNNGELSIEFPDEIRSLINVPDPPTLSITVEYTLEKPRGGIQFIPGHNAHCYTVGESRLWFPCVD